MSIQKMQLNLKQLSNYQLYEITQNQKLDKNIRTVANDEFNFRESDYAKKEQNE